MEIPATSPIVSGIICTHNPAASIFGRCLDALRRQEIPAGGMELIVVDNGSSTPLTMESIGEFPFATLVVREDRLGLSFARERGMREARGEILVYVDDDNILAPDFFQRTALFFADHPDAGAAGGLIEAVAETPLPSWFDTVSDHLAIRNLGPEVRCLSDEGWMAPCGAGLAVRKKAMMDAFSTPLLLTDRKGSQLSSGGDTELCYRIRLRDWQLWYVPELRLGHMLPPWRLSLKYIEALAFQFGLNVSLLEVYTFPCIRFRRLFYLRRAFYHWRLAEEEGRRLIAGEDSPDAVAARLRVHGLRGIATGFWRMAIGPPHWKAAAPFLRPAVPQ